MENNKIVERLKQDLKELRKYIEEFSLFLPLPVCSVNPLRVIVEGNKAFYDLVGYEKGELIGEEAVFKVETLFKEKKRWEELENKILNKQIVRSEEMTLITKDKKQIPINIAASSKQDEKGNLMGYFLALTDISELKALQENLEEKIRERTKELQKRVEELEKFHQLTVGRELKMVELKKKIKEFEKNK